jgi:hypothetical protein
MGTIDNVGPRSQHMTLIAWDAGVEVVYPEHMPELWTANNPG